MQKIIQRWRVLSLLLAVVGIALAVWAAVGVNSTVDDHRWLKKQPCAAPCWEGLTPGLTTAEDAVKLLQANPFFSDVEAFYRPKDAGLTWHWRGTKINAEAIFDGSSDIHVIQRITISLPHPSS